MPGSQQNWPFDSVIYGLPQTYARTANGIKDLRPLFLESEKLRTTSYSEEGAYVSRGPPNVISHSSLLHCILFGRAQVRDADKNQPSGWQTLRRQGSRPMLESGAGLQPSGHSYCRRGFTRALVRSVHREHTCDELLKTGIAAQCIKTWIDPDPHQPVRPLLDCLSQPNESLLFIL